MLQTIEVEIDAQGHIQLSEPLPPFFQGRALLTLLEPINHEPMLLSQQALAQDWFKPEEDKAWVHLQTEQTVETPKNRFADICGILTSEKSVSLEEMEQAIALQGLERFNDCH